MVLNRVKLIMEASPGADLNHCKVEAIKTALELLVNVEFKHNNRLFSVCVNDLFGQVVETKGGK